MLRMNYHRSSSNNPENLPLPVVIHTKSHQLSFNSCWNVRALHNLPYNTNHITRRHLELSYQFILSSRQHPWYYPSDNFHSIFPESPTLLPSFCSFPTGSYSKLSLGASFTVCSHRLHLFSSDLERSL